MDKKWSFLQKRTKTFLFPALFPKPFDKNHATFLLRQTMKYIGCPLFILLVWCLSSNSASAQDSSLGFADPAPDHKWVAPPPVDDNNRDVSYNLQALYQNDLDHPNSENSLLDFSVKRALDENSVMAEGLVRVEKGLSSSDHSDDIELRLARISLFTALDPDHRRPFRLVPNPHAQSFFRRLSPHGHPPSGRRSGHNSLFILLSTGPLQTRTSPNRLPLGAVFFLHAVPFLGPTSSAGWQPGFFPRSNTPSPRFG